MKSMWCGFLFLALTGCPVATSTMGGSTMGTPARASGADTSGTITVPDLFGMTRDEALAALQRAGFQGNVSDDSSLCGSIVEGRVVERGQVCHQHPPAGRVQGARLPLSIRVQTENPWAGHLGKPTEWRLMPKLAGMSLEQARARMQQVGFTRDDRISIVWVDEPGCRPLTVCRTYPEALQRAGINDGKAVFVGRDPDAKPEVPRTPPTTTPPTTTSPTTTPPTTPTTEPAREPEPEPFF